MAVFVNLASILVCILFIEYISVTINADRIQKDLKFMSKICFSVGFQTDINLLYVCCGRKKKRINKASNNVKTSPVCDHDLNSNPVL